MYIIHKISGRYVELSESLKDDVEDLDNFDLDNLSTEQLIDAIAIMDFYQECENGDGKFTNPEDYELITAETLKELKRVADEMLGDETAHH